MNTESRDETYRHVSELAGLDEHGGILPPPPGTHINRLSNPWWSFMPKKDGRQEGG